MPPRSLVCDVQDVIHLLLLPSPPSDSFASASVFSLFACADAFFVSTVFLCFDSILCLRRQLFSVICSMISWYLFTSSSFSSPAFFSLIPSVVFCCLELVSFFTMAILLRSSDHECCRDTSVITAHAHHVFGFGIFVVFQVSSLDYDVVDSLLNSFWGSVGRLFPRILPIHRVECCKIV